MEGLPIAFLKPSSLTVKKICHTMFAGGKGCVNHFVCKWEGFAPPPKPLLFLSNPCLWLKSCHGHGCSRGVRTIFFAKGLPSSERTIPAVKIHVIGMFAIREGKGGLFESLITTVMFLITLVTMTISIVFVHV